MKLLVVTHFYESHGGGIERVAAQLNREFARAGHDVTWAASDADPAPEAIRARPLRCVNPIEKLTGLPMPIPGPSALRALAQAVRDSDAVIVHDSLYFTSIAAALLAKAQGKPLALIQHIAGIAFASRALRAAMALANALVTRPMLAAADPLIFISASVRRELLGDPPRRVCRLLFNGVDPAVFHPSSGATGVVTREALGLPPDSALALFVGRFVEKKGLAIIEALARRRPDLAFAMVGAGPIRPESWALSNVHLLGPRTQPQLAALYRVADLLLLPSVGEGYPLVIQEAMACGLPVLCGEDSARADPDAAPWLSGVAIDLADPGGSSARCAGAIDALLAQKPDSEAMAAYATRAYSWRAMAEALVADISVKVDALHRATGAAQP